MTETSGGNHESQASPRKGASSQDGPEPALDREVIAVAPGKTAVTLITPNLVHRMNGDAQDVYDMPAETTKAVDYFAVPKRCRREGARQAWFVYSGNVHMSLHRDGFAISCHP